MISFSCATNVQHKVLNVNISLSQRCILPSQVPANVYVKKTALGQQTIDISGLAAPSSEKQDLEAANPSQEEVRIPALESSASLKTESVPSSPSGRTYSTEPAPLSTPAPPSSSPPTSSIAVPPSPPPTSSIAVP